MFEDRCARLDSLHRFVTNCQFQHNFSLDVNSISQCETWQMLLNKICFSRSFAIVLENVFSYELLDPWLIRYRCHLLNEFPDYVFSSDRVRYDWKKINIKWHIMIADYKTLVRILYYYSCFVWLSIFLTPDNIQYFLYEYLPYFRKIEKIHGTLLFAETELIW